MTHVRERSVTQSHVLALSFIPLVALCPLRSSQGCIPFVSTLTSHILSTVHTVPYVHTLPLFANYRPTFDPYMATLHGIVNTGLSILSVQNAFPHHVPDLPLWDPTVRFWLLSHAARRAKKRRLYSSVTNVGRVRNPEVRTP